MCSELHTKVGERIEAVRIIETFLILAVTALDLTVAPGRVRANQLVADTQFGSRRFKQGFQITAAVGETIGELTTVVCLNAFHSDAFVGEGFHDSAEEICGRIRALFGISAENAIAGILVDGGVLEQAQVWIGDALARNDLDVDLDALAGMRHLLVRSGNVLFLLLRRREHIKTMQHAAKRIDVSGIAPLSQSMPQLYDAEIGIPAPHVADQLEFGFRMLVRMMMRTPGFRTQRFYAAVPPRSPEVDVGCTPIVLPACTRDAVFLCVSHQGLTKPHVLCYSVHEE